MKKKQKKITPDFDFEIKKNDEGLPNCTTWITYYIRNDITRFGDVFKMHRRDSLMNGGFHIVPLPW